MTARAVEIVLQCRNALLQAIALAGLHDNHTCDRKGGGGITWLVTFTKSTYMEKNSVQWYPVVLCVHACAVVHSVPDADLVKKS